MKAHQKTLGNKNEWLTPKWILDPLGEFDLDPCSPIKRPWKWDTAKNYFTELDDGLSKQWFGRVWCNPPFNRNIRPLWMKKMSKHNNGIMLLPANMETQPFKEFVFGNASGILILNKRPHFYHVNGVRGSENSGCTICLIAYGADNLRILKESGLGYVVKETNRDQSEGAYITHEYRVKHTENAILSAIKNFESKNRKITKAAIARDVGITREHLSRRYSHLFGSAA